MQETPESSIGRRIESKLANLIGGDAPQCIKDAAVAVLGVVNPKAKEIKKMAEGIVEGGVSSDDGHSE